MQNIHNADGRAPFPVLSLRMKKNKINKNAKNFKAKEIVF